MAKLDGLSKNIRTANLLRDSNKCSIQPMYLLQENKALNDYFERFAQTALYGSSSPQMKKKEDVSKC